MTAARKSLRVNEFAGFAIVGALAIGTLGWAAGTELSGAVIAGGVVAVRDVSKDVQHLEGGVVRQILVAEGNSVRAGEILVRLDDTRIKAKLAMIDGQLIELAAEQARLEAERENADDFSVVDPGSEYATAGAAERAADGQRRHFASMRDTIRKKKDQLQEQMEQVEASIAGTEAKLASTEKQSQLASSELEVLQSLMERGLTTRNRIFAMERDLAQLKGQAEDLRSNVAAQRARKAEIKIKMLEIDDQRRTEVTGRLSEVRAKLAELLEQRNFETFRLRGTEIVAPISGRVHNLRVHTAEAVVSAGAVLMTIVPSEEALVFRVRVRPEDIDRLYVGQPARLRLTAFNARTTPEIDGEVSAISADQLVDQQSGLAYFRIDITAALDSIAGLDTRKIKPGVPVEAFVTTEPQTVMSYLLKPLVDQFAKALRES